MPDLRDGVGTKDGHLRGGEKPRIGEHDQAVLDLHSADDSTSGCHHVGSYPCHVSANAVGITEDLAMVRMGCGDSGGAVGRLAVLRAWVAIHRYAQPKHVHADRAGI